MNFFKEYFLGNNLVAAPLAGVTNIPFRKIVRRFFDGLIYSEMISTEGVARGVKKTLKLSDVTEVDPPIFLQLFGNNPTSFEESVKVLEDYSDPAGFDINAGCPVKKVLRSKAGAYHLKDLDNFIKIIKAVKKSTKKPLTIKTRLGFEKNNYVYKEVINIAHNEGVDAIILHGRTKADLFSGEVDLDKISEAVSISKLPIIGNGDVTDIKSYLKMKSTGVAGVMIGRGMMNAPWIFSALKENKEPSEYLFPGDIYKLLLEFSVLEKEYRRSRCYIEIMKKYAVWFSKGFKGVSEFRRKVYTAFDETEFFDIIEKFYLHRVAE